MWQWRVRGWVAEGTVLLDVTGGVLVLLGFGDDGVVVWVRVMETGEA